MRRKTSWVLAVLATLPLAGGLTEGCGGTSSDEGDGGDAEPSPDTGAPGDGSGGSDSPEDRAASQDSAPSPEAGDAMGTGDASEAGDASDGGMDGAPPMDASDGSSHDAPDDHHHPHDAKPPPFDVVPPIDAVSIDAPPPFDAPPPDASEPLEAGFPPPPPFEASAPTTATQDFAIHELFLGDTDFSGTGDLNAWKQLGYDVDGKVTTAASTNVCTLAKGASKTIQVDGLVGIDNSFGENFFDGLILGIDSGASAGINASLAAGAPTSLLEVTGLSPSPTQTANGLTAQVFATAQFSGKPTWTVADLWPLVTGDLTVTTPPFQSVQKFPSAYVVSGTWVSGPPADFSLPGLTLGGAALPPLTVHQAVVTFDHSSKTHAAHGIVSGVLDTNEMLAAVTTIAGQLGLCGSSVTAILAQIKTYQDILLDGTSPPSVPCDAISIGIGFTADEVGQPTSLGVVCPQPDLCSDATAPVCDGGLPTDSGGAD